ncbi:MAG TPA: LysE family transporter [Rhizomicrobium sp.]|jgi:threonine/homoserine/homoserine lactone efflux protein|nr:LysE family transporter [Rhizomicrobium sp.]
MSSVLLLLPGLIIGFLVAAPIGPINLICMRRTLAYGALTGFVSGLGAAMGDGIFAAIIGFGLTAIRHWIEGYSQVLQIAGGALLLGFGIHTYLADPLHGREFQYAGNGDRVRNKPSLLRSFASTFAIALSNPATLFAFAALFTGFGGFIGIADPTLAQAAFVVAGILCGSALWWLTITMIVNAYHDRISDRVMRIITHVSGMIICVFGLGMLTHVLLGHFG